MGSSNLIPALSEASQTSPNPVLQPPSSTLPVLSKLSSFSSHHISRALNDLKTLYWPPKSRTCRPTSVVPSNLVLPTRKLKHLQHIHDYSVPDSGYASAEDSEDDTDEEEDLVCNGVSSATEEVMEVLRADPFERAFVIKWVTGFIARADIWAEEARRVQAIDQASAILSMFIGDESTGEEDSAVTRSFSFPFHEPDSDGRRPLGGEPKKVDVDLNDDPLDKEDHTSVGLQSWASAIVMSEKMCADPRSFSLDLDSETSNTKSGKKRILELGAGTGLLSIVAAKIFALQPPSIMIPRHAQEQGKVKIIATDFHPNVLANCVRNVETNFPSSTSTSSPVHVCKLDWEHPDYTSPVDEPFDLILAADVIYHPDHAKWIRSVVEKLLKQPSREMGENGGIFWMMMAVRQTGRHEGLDKTVDEVFPDVSDTVASSGRHLAVTHRAEFAKQGGLGRADEGGYKLFGIEWVNS
ncbi:hypothetical protein K435DRAFT_769751 [Dendrothele bispora CBS 962.96]|uniref:S-adenosyl-L-methionine-dependent methyltransferase n=1 Tax=Dendrothele bispora (strain CBS 962.96) TaxID=1314807 RepID=A0A4S8KQM7_DENBC|nr:hypothetical protein K435DRAFT_769751 [Dendrothele bispora CBS 962.96]